MLKRFGAPRWYYWFWTYVMRAALVLFARRHATGAANCPRKGPLIVVSNHVSYADPPVIAGTLPRRVHFMAKQELFDRRFMGAHIRMYGSYPVRRFEADLAALRTSIEILDRGEPIGLFPEGTRGKTASMQRAYAGVGLIALRSGAPVLPVAVWGTEHLVRRSVFWKRPRVYVTVGEPIAFPAMERVRTADAAAATERIMRTIAALLPPSYRGVYAGETVETPESKT